MAQRFSNNGSTTLVAGIEANDTTIIVISGGGDSFPTINPDDDEEFAQCTIEDNFGNFEIVRANGRIGDSFAVERASEGTTALAFPTGARFELRTTRDTLLNFLQRSGETIDGGIY